MGQKIVITANMKNKTQRIARKDVEYQWHWRRITMAVGVALVASSGLWYATGTPAIAEQASAAQSAVDTSETHLPGGADAQETHEALVVAKPTAGEVLPSDNVAVLASAVDDSEEIVEQALDTSEATTSAQETLAEKSTTEAAKDIAQVEVTAVADAQSAASTDDSQQQDGTVADEEFVADNRNEFDQQAKVANLAQGSKIDTDKVSRAVLTTNIEDREPVSSLGREVSMGDFDGQLVFFTELRGLQGQKVHHIWYYEGQALANVELGVHTARYRTFSSKNIMPSQTGLWRVELRDSNNKLLATREFRLIAKL
ncbi:DUF2914 domain-containing protein [Pseudoalteromonas pernae]|uniref:DUF2914 domain-containing protein n=1 Tax=Pseudoalteromonas pernae TaxID=3118054 RepID=UPI003241D0C4